MTHYKKEEGKNGKHLDQKRTIPSLTNETMKRLASSVELQTCRHHRAVLKGLSIANTDRLLLGHSLSPSYVHIYTCIHLIMPRIIGLAQRVENCRHV